MAKLKAFLPKLASSMDDVQTSADPVSIENVFTSADGGEGDSAQGVQGEVSPADSSDAKPTEEEESGSVQMVRMFPALAFGICDHCTSYLQEVALGLWDDEKEADEGIKKLEGKDEEEDAPPAVTDLKLKDEKKKKPVIEEIGS
jgi:hypothetical protein